MNTETVHCTLVCIYLSVGVTVCSVEKPFSIAAPLLVLQELQLYYYYFFWLLGIPACLSASRWRVINSWLSLVLFCRNVLIILHVARFTFFWIGLILLLSRTTVFVFISFSDLFLGRVLEFTMDIIVTSFIFHYCLTFCIGCLYFSCFCPCLCCFLKL